MQLIVKAAFLVVPLNTQEQKVSLFEMASR